MKIVILHNGFLLRPEPDGLKSIIIMDRKIAQIVDPSKVDSFVKAAEQAGIQVQLEDCTGHFICPGFIDSHVHLTGGGGELGPKSRTPEAKVSELAKAGLTTVIGLLGTDGISRTLENLHAKVLGLREEGLNAFMFTGGYRVPIFTITGSTQRDLMLIEPVIGVGEIALSDHRGTYPSPHSLYELVSDSRVGGMLSGKCGVVQVHVGDGKKHLEPLWDIVHETDIPISQFHPTHVSSRGPDLIKNVNRWLEEGGSCDLTADEPGFSDTVELLNEWRRKPFLSRVTLSSDAYGSLPVFDADGKLLKYEVASPAAGLDTIRKLIKEFNWTLPEALPILTKNVASIYKLRNKGELKVDYDADIVVLTKELNVEHVLANGVWLKQGTVVKKGMFE